MMKSIKKLSLYLFVIPMLFVLAGVLWLPQTKALDGLAATASASFNATALDTKDQDAKINNEDRNVAYALIINHMNSLKSLYDLSADTIKRMDEVFYQANVYIANTDMTVGELKRYVGVVESNLSAAVGNASVLSNTSSFIMLSDDTPVATGKYGQSMDVTLSVINLGKEDVTDVVITPVVSNNVKEWPFVISDASDVRMISRIPKAGSVEAAAVLKQDVTWSFVVASEAPSGTYPLKFHAKYYRNGNIEETDLVTYVTITGKASSGDLINLDDPDELTSTPRIIITGFTTDPETVYAGDTFNLTITVKNTSSTTAVSNIQFDLTADVTGEDNKTLYAAFLPTSGSSTIYVSSIPAGQSADLNIELSSRSDLTQKPYVIDVKAQYEDDDNHPYTAETNLSVPIKQEARVDTGDAEVVPGVIVVGDSANVTFDVYNKGRTTLYNVAVSFADGYVSGGNAYLGKLDTGGTANADVMVTGLMTNEDKGYITATISYEDEGGVESSFEKEIYIDIIEDMSYDDFDDMQDFDYMDMEPTAAAPSWLKPFIIVLVIVGAVVAIVIVTKKRKANKLKKLLELENDSEDDN